jgi:AcrR family transcriptional regulator
MPKRDASYMTERRDEILDAAITCLLRTGIAGFSTTAICEEAGISMGALYTHFSTKEAVLLGIAERARARRTWQFDVKSVKSLRARILSIIDELSTPRAQQTMRIDLELLSAAGLSSQLAKGFPPFRISAEVSSALKRLKDSGELRAEVNITAAATIIETMVAGLVTLNVSGKRSPKADRAAMRLVLDSIL